MYVNACFVVVLVAVVFVQVVFIFFLALISQNNAHLIAIKTNWAINHHNCLAAAADAVARLFSITAVVAIVFYFIYMYKYLDVLF